MTDHDMIQLAINQAGGAGGADVEMRRRAQAQLNALVAAVAAPSAGPVGDIPDPWVEAAAKAVEDRLKLFPIGTVPALGWGATTQELAGDALTAALPMIRAHIADELDEQANHEAPNAAEALRFAAGQIAAGLPQLHAVVSARRAAARVARGGTDD